MENLKISEQKFKNHLIKKFNFKDVINYYGMIEQTGSIFFKCSTCDLFITSIFSDIIIRDNDFSSIIGKEGLVQLYIYFTIKLSGPQHTYTGYWNY